MLPPGFVDSNDTPVPQNEGQKYLWKCWSHAAELLNPLDILVLNGDVIDGFQDKQKGTELRLPLIADQSRAAIECIRFMWERTGKPDIYAVSGTEYHDGKAAREMEVVAEGVGAKRYPGPGPGLYCKDVLDLDVEGIALNFHHEISVTQGLYLATSPDKEALFSAVAGKAGKAAKSDALIRSHVHYFVHVEHANKHIFVTPCWQLQTGYMRRKSVYRMIPDIGFLLLLVNPNIKRDDWEDPIGIAKHIYPLPRAKVTKWEPRRNDQTTQTT